MIIELGMKRCKASDFSNTKNSGNKNNTDNNLYHFNL